MHENPITSENRSEASGEIDPDKEKHASDAAEDLRTEIGALEMQKEAAGRNVEEIHDKMKEIQEGPKTGNLHDVNLQLLNALQKELDIYQERYNSLGRQLASKRLELKDIE